MAERRALVLISGRLHELPANDTLLVSGSFASQTDLTATGASLFARDESISGALVAQINVSAAGVSSLNGLSGILGIVGAGYAAVTTSGSNVVVSGMPPVLERVLYTTGEQTVSGELTFAGRITGNSNSALRFDNDVSRESAVVIYRGASGDFWMGTHGNIFMGKGVTGWWFPPNVIADNSSTLLSVRQKGRDTTPFNQTLRIWSLNEDDTNENVFDYAQISATRSYLKIYSFSGLSNAHAQFDIRSTSGQEMARLHLRTDLANGLVARETVYTETGFYYDTAGGAFIDTSSSVLGGTEPWSLTVTGDWSPDSVASVAQLTASSGALASQIAGASAGVTSLNALSGALTVAGAGSVTVTTDGSTITVSGTAGGAGDVTSEQLTNTGVALGARIDTTQTNLASTGSVLDTRIGLLSGYGAATYATLSSLAATGQQALAAAQGHGVNLSGNLTQTGVQLGSKIDSVSGWAASATNVTTTGIALGARVDSALTNLTATGAALGLKIDNLSGYADSTFAAQTNLASTGQQAWTAANTNAIHLSGALAQTGATLISLISAASAGVSSLNGASGVLTLVGAGSVTITEDGQTITVSGTAGGAGDVTSEQLTSTGVQLGVKIDSLSGYSNATFAAATNLTATGATLNSRIASLSGYSDNTFATITSLTATGATLGSQIGTVNGNLAATGSVLDGRVNSLSGYGTATYATLQSLALTGQQAWAAADSNAIALSGALGQTGSSLDGRINTVTSNLTATGQTLQDRISSLSGYAASAADLQGTGSSLYQLVTNLSGQADTNYATKTAVASTGQQAWSAAQNNAVNLSGAIEATGIALIGMIGGATAGVSAVNGLTGSISIIGTGGLAITTDGQVITVSGDFALASEQFFVTGVPQGSDSFYVNFPTAFGSTPVILPTLQVGDGSIYGIALSEPSNTGFRALFTTPIVESDVSLNVYAIESGGLIGGVAGGGAGDVTSSQLAATGQQAWTAAQNNAINLSGSLIASGALLSAVSVTGSATINNPILTGIGGAQVIQSGTYILISGGAGGGDSGPVTFSKGGSFYNADGISSGIHRTIGWCAPFNCTATAVRGYVYGGGTATINAIRNESLNLLSADLVVNTTGVWTATTDLQNGSFLAGDSLAFQVTNAADAPTSIGIQVNFTKP